MRPLELTLHGFRSYREPTTFDWRGRRLVGVVGPIGAGKSTILDGVAFALFGKTPTFERDTKSLIHQLAETCHVELRFEVDAQVWRVARALRRKGASGHQLQRLAADVDDAEVLEHVTGERQIRARVEELLGMDFGAFCRSVLLAQNRFSEFLKARPAERNEVLKGVFGYERFDAAHEAARRRAAAAGAELAMLEREGEQLSRAREELATAEGALEEAVARADRLRGARPAFDALQEEAAANQTRRVRADERLLELDAITRSLPTQERLEADLAAAERVEEAIAEATEGAERAEEVRKEADAAYAAAAERAGDRSAFAALVQQLDHRAEDARKAEERRARLETATAEVRTQAAAARERADEAESDRVAAATRHHTATAAVTEAEAALHEARHADMARSLRRELVAGDPCPVCDRPVTAVPTLGRAPKIESAAKALERARADDVAARAHAERAGAEAVAAMERASALAAQVTRAEEEIGEAEAELRATEAELAAVQSQLVDRLGEGDPHALLAEREAEVRDADEARARAGEVAAAARETLAELRAGQETAREGLTRIATELAGVWGRLGERSEVGAGAAELRAAFVAVGERLIEDHAAARRDLTEADDAIARVASSVADLLQELALDASADFAEALAEAAAAQAAAQTRVDGLRATVGAAAALEARTEAARRGLDLATRLASDLQPSRFLAFLLEEERAALADLGSVHLEELSNGAYRFTDDDRFDVVDMNAAATSRTADSLSGGETFLASLALALALAEMVARGGGRLDAFFLDEGFGSLDPEHLERAMDGIGKLVADDGRRLVVLVSHVDQMRQMLEDLIVLDKDGRTGDTVVVSGARLA